MTDKREKQETSIPCNKRRKQDESSSLLDVTEPSESQMKVFRCQELTQSISTFLKTREHINSRHATLLIPKVPYDWSLVHQPQETQQIPCIDQMTPEWIISHRFQSARFAQLPDPLPYVKFHQRHVGWEDQRLYKNLVHALLDYGCTESLIWLETSAQTEKQKMRFHQALSHWHSRSCRQVNDTFIEWCQKKLKHKIVYALCLQSGTPRAQEITHILIQEYGWVNDSDYDVPAVIKGQSEWALRDYAASFALEIEELFIDQDLDIIDHLMIQVFQEANLWRSLWTDFSDETEVELHRYLAPLAIKCQCVSFIKECVITVIPDDPSERELFIKECLFAALDQANVEIAEAFLHVWVPEDDALWDHCRSEKHRHDHGVRLVQCFMGAELFFHRKYNDDHDWVHVWKTFGKVNPCSGFEYLQQRNQFHIFSTFIKQSLYAYALLFNRADLLPEILTFDDFATLTAIWSLNMYDDEETTYHFQTVLTTLPLADQMRHVPLRMWRHHEQLAQDLKRDKFCLGILTILACHDYAAEVEEIIGVSQFKHLCEPFRKNQLTKYLPLHKSEEKNNRLMLHWLNQL